MDNPVSPTAGRRLISAREYKRRRGDPSEMTLWRDEKRGIGPKPVRINGRRFWIESEVEDYLNQLAANRSAPDESVKRSQEVQHGAS